MNVIITGASRGIGYELVKQFAASGGYTVYAVSRNTGRLDALRMQCAADFPRAVVHPISVDLLNDDSIKGFTEQLKSENISVDILIHNAGALVNKPFEKLTGDDFDQVFGVNVKSVFRLTQFLQPLMKPGSHIVNISSMGGYQGAAKFNGLSLYSASKGAVAVLTEALAEEFKPHKIAVNCLALGAVQTEMLAEAFPGYQAPLQPVDMARYIFSFATDGHRYFNGKILPVSLSTP